MFFSENPQCAPRILGKSQLGTFVLSNEMLTEVFRENLDRIPEGYNNCHEVGAGVKRVNRAVLLSRTTLLDFVPSGNMTVQMEMGIRRLHTLPVLCSKVEWEPSLHDSEFPLASKLVDMNGMNGLKYTSLRDIMPCSPTSMGSPRREANWCSCTTISIKNNLVKHAACAYLQPMITESHNDDDFFACCLSMFTNESNLFSSFKDYITIPINACIGFFTTQILSNLSKTFGYLTGQLGGIFGVRVQKK